MVGTKPTRRPAACCLARQARTAETEVRIGNGAGGRAGVRMLGRSRMVYAGPTFGGDQGLSAGERELVEAEMAGE